MSGLFGFFHLDGRPADSADLARMSAPMAHWGTDGGGVRTEHQAALGVHVRRITPEDRFDTQPLRLAEVTLVAHARLDNRAELLASLKPATPPDETPDSALVLQAYLRHGDDCVQHLRGDWAFALWDGRQRKLVVARDATGNTSLYWWCDAKQMVFASNVHAVLAHPAVPCRPNAQQIAGFLTEFFVPAFEDETAYEGIRRLAPGHMLIADGREVRKHRWWRPEALPPLPYQRPEDYDEAFVALYQDAVAQRLRVHDGEVALLMSAGLDSGSVAALAAPALAQQGKRLKGYVHRPASDNAIVVRWERLTDELPDAQLTAQHIGNTDVFGHDNTEVSVLQGIRRGLQVHGLPIYGASNQYWLLDMCAKARAGGAKVLLTGQGGNATVSFNGHGSLLPELRRGHVATVLSALAQDLHGPWAALKQRLLKPMARPMKASLIRRTTFARSSEPWAYYAALNRDFAHSLALTARMRQAGFDPNFNNVGGQAAIMQAFRLGTRKAGTAGAVWMELGAHHQLDVRDPTRDQRIVEFCWRVPDSVFWGQGEQRALIRRAMRQALPDPVMYPQKKGLQGADLGSRLQSIQGEIAQALDALERHELARAWLDIPRMRQSLAGINPELSKMAFAGQAGVLVRGLSVGLFLQRF